MGENIQQNPLTSDLYVCPWNKICTGTWLFAAGQRAIVQAYLAMGLIPCVQCQLCVLVQMRKAYLQEHS